MLIVVVPIIESGSWPFHYELPLLVAASSFLSYVSFFSAGLPFILALGHRDKLTKINLLLGGIVLGGIAGVLFSIGFALLLGSPLTGHGQTLATWLSPAPWGAAMGFAVAFTYGLIAGWPKNSFSRHNGWQ